MPWQKPTSRSISRSYRVRCSSRCASSSLPCSRELGEPLVQLRLDRLDGPLQLLFGRDEVLGRVDVQALLLAR